MPVQEIVNSFQPFTSNSENIRSVSTDFFFSIFQLNVSFLTKMNVFDFGL